jgi:hypothetical protein
VLITGHFDSIRTLVGLRILRPEVVIEGHAVAVPIGPDKSVHPIRLSRRAPVELRLLHADAVEAGARFELAVEDDGVASHGVPLLELEPWLDFLFERDRPVHVRVGSDGVGRFEARIGARLRVRCWEVSQRGELRERGAAAVIEVREGGTSATIDAS